MAVFVAQNSTLYIDMKSFTQIPIYLKFYPNTNLLSDC